MTTLRQTLDGIRAATEKKIPAAALHIMHRATEDLQKSGLIDKALKVGEAVPSFSAVNSFRDPVDSDDLFRTGPIVISFFRGHW